LREAAVLRAVEEAIVTEYPAAVGQSSMRSILRMLSGGIDDDAQQQSAPSAREAPAALHLVSS
jgi:hypothetical protein